MLPVFVQCVSVSAVCEDVDGTRTHTQTARRMYACWSLGDSIASRRGLGRARNMLEAGFKMIQDKLPHELSHKHVINV